MFYLCFYIWMTQNTEREARGGRGDECRWFLCMPGSGGERQGGRQGPDGACHSNVRHLFSQWGRRDNAGDSWWQRQLVVPLAPACDPLWGDTSLWKKKRREKESGEKNPSLTNQNSGPDALPAPTGEQCHADARLACQTIPSLSQHPTSPSSSASSFHLPFSKPSPHRQCREALGAVG